VTNTFLSWDQNKLTVNENYARVLEASDLTKVEAFFNLPTATEINNHRRRPVFRIELPDPAKGNGAGLICYFKRYQYPQLKNSLKPLLTGRGPMSLARREWQAILALQEAGVRSMIPLALGEEYRAGFETRSFLLTVEVPDLLPLNEFINAAVSQMSVDDFRRFKRKLIKDVAIVSARMHQAGIIHGDYYTKHIMLQGKPEQYELYILDLQRCEQRKRISKTDIARELAGLSASAKRSIFTSTDRLRFYHYYSGSQHSRDKDRRLFSKIARRVSKLSRRKKFQYFQNEDVQLNWKRAQS